MVDYRLPSLYLAHNILTRLAERTSKRAKEGTATCRPLTYREAVILESTPADHVEAKAERQALCLLIRAHVDEIQPVISDGVAALRAEDRELAGRIFTRLQSALPEYLVGATREIDAAKVRMDILALRGMFERSLSELLAVESEQKDKQSQGLSGWLTPGELAETHGLPLDALRKRLERYRKKTMDGWKETGNRKSREARFVFNVEMARPIIDAMKAGQRKRPANNP